MLGGSLSRPLCVVVAQASGEKRRLLVSALQRGSFHVTPASDGAGALELLCQVGPDVIIADLDGRDLDGLLLCRVLRSLHAHAMLPVLVLTTASSNDAHTRQMLTPRNVRLLWTPADPAVLVAAVSEMINIGPAGRPRASPPWSTAPRMTSVGVYA
jgi:CheY-like chemotaxis protein